MSAENKYAPGELVRLTARFQDPITGDPVNPGEVTCEVLNPDAATAPVDLSYHEALETVDGVVGPGWEGFVDAELPGYWYYRFVATGQGQSAQEGSFYVERSALA